MDDIELKITGLDELERALEELPVKASRRIVSQEASAAIQPWAEEMRTLVRKGWHVFEKTILRDRRKKESAPGGRTRDYGVIAQNIETSTKVGADGLSGTVKVGPDKGAFWARYLEFGTRKMRAYPFIRPAFEVDETAVLDRFIQGIRDALAAAGLKLS